MNKETVEFSTLATKLLSIQNYLIKRVKLIILVSQKPLRSEGPDTNTLESSLYQRVEKNQSFAM